MGMKMKVTFYCDHDPCPANQTFVTDPNRPLFTLPDERNALGRSVVPLLTKNLRWSLLVKPGVSGRPGEITTHCPRHANRPSREVVRDLFPE